MLKTIRQEKKMKKFMAQLRIKPFTVVSAAYLYGGWGREGALGDGHNLYGRSRGGGGRGKGQG